MFSNNTDDIDFQQLVMDALEAEDDLREYEIIETTTKLLTGKCHSGMPRPERVGGISTPKEFEAIKGAISFAKLINYPITIDLIRALSGIKISGNHKNEKRIYTLIGTILELSQIYDDLYSDKRREVYRDEVGDYVASPDGSVDREIDKTTITFLKSLDDIRSNNKMLHSVEPIVYRDLEK